MQPSYLPSWLTVYMFFPCHFFFRILTISQIKSIYSPTQIFQKISNYTLQIANIIDCESIMRFKQSLFCNNM